MKNNKLILRNIVQIRLGKLNKYEVKRSSVTLSNGKYKDLIIGIYLYYQNLDFVALRMNVKETKQLIKDLKQKLKQYGEKV